MSMLSVPWSRVAARQVCYAAGVVEIVFDEVALDAGNIQGRVEYDLVAS
jgi:hypothetical protein